LFEEQFVPGGCLATQDPPLHWSADDSQSALVVHVARHIVPEAHLRPLGHAAAGLQVLPALQVPGVSMPPAHVTVHAVLFVEVHCTQVWVVVLQAGVAPLQSASALHTTHEPLPSHTLPPLSEHTVPLLTSLKPQVMFVHVFVLHAVVCAGQSLGCRQPTHLPASQTRLAPQSVLVLHWTQVPLLSQSLPLLSVQTAPFAACVVPQQPPVHVAVTHAVAGMGHCAVVVHAPPASQLAGMPMPPVPEELLAGEPPEPPVLDELLVGEPPMPLVDEPLVEELLAAPPPVPLEAPVPLCELPQPMVPAVMAPAVKSRAVKVLMYMCMDVTFVVTRVATRVGSLVHSPGYETRKPRENARRTPGAVESPRGGHQGVEAPIALGRHRRALGLGTNCVSASTCSSRGASSGNVNRPSRGTRGRSRPSTSSGRRRRPPLPSGASCAASAS
jgi:hypothetical protein